MTHYPSLQELKEALGENYTIRVIDLEECLYRDFGNGFNVEISGCSQANHKRFATLYLWWGDKYSTCRIVKTVRNVERDAKEIGEIVELFRGYSDNLIARGYDGCKEVRRHDRQEQNKSRA